MNKKKFYIKPNIRVHRFKVHVMGPPVSESEQEETTPGNIPISSKDYDGADGGYRQVGRMGFIEDDEW